MTGRNGPTALLGRLRADEAGVSTVEFALGAPLVIMLLLMLLELGYLLGGGLLLEAGARAAGRYAVIGQSTGGETREQAIRRIVTSYVCPRALPDGEGGHCFWSAGVTGLGDDNGGALVIEARAYADPSRVGEPEPYSDTSPQNGRYDPGEPYDDINGNGQWDADMARSGAGGPSDFVVYELRMAEDIVNPLFRLIAGRSVLWHTASLAVRNEDFP